MTRLLWNANLRLSTGLSHGAIYLDGQVVPWFGLSSVKIETPGEAAVQYLDGQANTVRQPHGETSASLTAYAYPEVLDRETSTSRQLTGLTYRTSRYLHMIYNPFVYLEAYPYQTDADSDSAIEFSFSADARPEHPEGHAAISHLMIDLDEVNPIAQQELEALLYGTDVLDPRWPTIEEVIELVEAHTVLRIIDHRDGTWTAIGPDSAIKMVSATEFEITWPSAYFIGEHIFRISSL